MKITTAIGHCWIDFDNGYKLSIFNGFGSYSENHMNFEQHTKILKDKDLLSRWESKDVEVAIIKDGKFVTSEILDVEDDIKGYVSVEELIEIINKVKNI